MSADTPIAYGRISVILAAKDAHGNDLCVKVFKEGLESISERQDLFAEVEAARRLQHPNILPILDFGEHVPTGRAFLVMKLCRRGNLETMLRARSFLPVPEALKILEPVAGAIDYAHESGMVHGDIKLANILLAEAPDRPCLSDFGMAKYYVGTTTEFGRTQSVFARKPMRQSSTKVLISRGGSIPYLSPEQVSLGVHSPKSDIYSFGIVAYELLTGRVPFRDSDPFFYQLKAKVEGRIVPPAEVNPALSPAVCDALMFGLDVDPKCRPASAGEMVACLKGERPVPGRQSTAARFSQVPVDNKSVFVIHGHAHGALETIARFLEHLDLRPIVVMETPGGGRTIIEQIERNAGVAAAVAIITADDLGAAKTSGEDTRPRPRQNVVFELGYFVGKLGRERTITICEPGVELPSDFDGVVYLALDRAGAWRLQLARALSGLGLPVDRDRLVG